jgi:hypothetical protein
MARSSRSKAGGYLYVSEKSSGGPILKLPSAAWRQFKNQGELTDFRENISRIIFRIQLQTSAVDVESFPSNRRLN